MAEAEWLEGPLQKAVQGHEQNQGSEAQDVEQMGPRRMKRAHASERREGGDLYKRSWRAFGNATAKAMKNKAHVIIIELMEC